MEKATKKIVDCILKKQKIGVLGDYDVDGSSATSLICNYFSEMELSMSFIFLIELKKGMDLILRHLKH